MTPAPVPPDVRVSVVTPFLDAAAHLREAIESVLAQTWPHWELLLVDDGSTDDGPAIAREYAARHPDRIRLLQHPGGGNRGTAASRNLAGRHARGAYVAPLDADDVWLPERLAHEVPLLERHPGAAMVWGPQRYWYGWTGDPADAARDHVVAAGRPADPAESVVDARALLLAQLEGHTQTPCPSGLVVRRAVLERVGGWVEGVPNSHEDLFLLARLFLAAPVVLSARTLMRYRCYPPSAGNVSSVAARTGTFAQDRLVYLEWLAGCLVEHGMAGSPHHRLVVHTLRRQRGTWGDRLALAAARLRGRAAGLLGRREGEQATA